MMNTTTTMGQLGSCAKILTWKHLQKWFNSPGILIPMLKIPTLQQKLCSRTDSPSKKSVLEFWWANLLHIYGMYVVALISSYCVSMLCTHRLYGCTVLPGWILASISLLANASIVSIIWIGGIDRIPPVTGGVLDENSSSCTHIFEHYIFFKQFATKSTKAHTRDDINVAIMEPLVRRITLKSSPVLTCIIMIGYTVKMQLVGTQMMTDTETWVQLSVPHS